MIIVADTSALVALAVCDSLELLVKLFDKVFVPLSVYKECTVPKKPHAEQLEVFLDDKIFREDIEQNLQLPSSLGKGEVDAMILYKLLDANVLLMDDYRARKIALINKINIIGSLGVLLLAKNRKLIKYISPFLDKIDNSDIFFDKQLLNQIKQFAGE